MRFIILCLFLVGCSTLHVPTMEETIVVNLKVQDNWCMSDGVYSNGSTYWKPGTREIYMCISRGANVEEVFLHEFEHVWLLVTGNDPQYYNK